MKDKLLIRDFQFGVELESNLSNSKVINSLRPTWRSHSEHCGSEVVSPKLKGAAGLLELRRQVKALCDIANSVGFRQCGLHVHVDINHFTLGDAKRLLILNSRFDRTIFAIMDGSRYKNKYTTRCSYPEEKIENCMSLEDLKRLQLRTRYAGTNFYAFTKHGTVEFRYAGGTFDWQKIYSLVSMYLRMVSLSCSMREIPQPTKCHDESFNTLESNINIFFDALQIRGHTRKILYNMFSANWDKKSVTKKNKQKLKFIGCMSK